MSNEYSGYLIVVATNVGSLWEIKPIGKGSVVKDLRGLYTSQGAARQAIDAYLESKKGKRDGKASSTDRG